MYARVVECFYRQTLAIDLRPPCGLFYFQYNTALFLIDWKIQ